MVRVARSAARAARRIADSVPVRRARWQRNMFGGAASAGPARSGYVPGSQQPSSIRDGGGYNQMTTNRVTTGRKLSKEAVRRKVTDTTLVTYRYRFSQLRDWSASTNNPNGQYFLHYGARTDNAALMNVPLFLFNLSSVRQTAALAESPMHRLVYNTTADGYVWKKEYGLNSAAGADTTWGLEDNAAASTLPLGRKALLNWTRARLLMYGKTSAPTRVQIQVVQFLDDLYCPEKQTFTSSYSPTLTNEAAELWSSIVKPLINNPIASQLKLKKPTYKVLKTVTVEINPTSSTESDADPHMKVIDLFSRWGKVFDFSEVTSNLGTEVELEDGNKWPAPSVGYGCLPKTAKSSIYLMITSMQPYKSTEATTTNAETASFDVNIQTAWSTTE